MIKQTGLDNGLRIGLETMEHLKSVSVGVWVGSGSRQETAGDNGAAHLIEHMMFKGTHRRSARRIMEEIEERGGSLNAFTGRECTCYYSRVLREDLPLVMDLLGDMFFHSRFSPEDLENEKQVIKEEIGMVEDDPDDWIHDLLYEELFPSHPLGRSILGSRRSVADFRRDTIRSFYRTHYTAGNTVLALAGGITEEEVLDLAGRHFSAFGEGGRRPPGEPAVAVRSFRHEPRESEQVNLCLGAPGYPREDPRYYDVLFLNNLLGGNASSRLFQEIREKRGLAYSVYSYHSAYTDCGVFAVCAGTSPDRLPEVLRLVRESIMEMRAGGITPEELERTRRQLAAQLQLSNESASSRMKMIGSNLVGEGRIIPEEEMVEAIGNVTLHGLCQTAAEMLSPEKFSLVSIGPGTPDGIRKEWECLCEGSGR